MTYPSKSQIRKTRKAARLTQAQAAELIGYTRASWARWENGSVKMRMRMFETFKMISGVS